MELKNIHKAYDTVVVDSVSLTIPKNQLTAFIGPNGAGKSTLLKILSGEIQPDTGNIALEKNAKIGYLKQDIDFVQGRTVLEEAYQAFTNLMSLEEELDKIHLEMTERTDYESESYNELLIRLHEVTHQYEIYG